MEEQKDNSCPHRPRKEIDMDKYISMYNDGLSNDQIASKLKVSRRTLYRRMEEDRFNIRKKEPENG